MEGERFSVVGGVKILVCDGSRGTSRGSVQAGPEASFSQTMHSIQGQVNATAWRNGAQPRTVLQVVPLSDGWNVTTCEPREDQVLEPHKEWWRRLPATDSSSSAGVSASAPPPLGPRPSLEEGPHR